jgi:hypothetical protein
MIDVVDIGVAKLTREFAEILAVMQDLKAQLRRAADEGRSA